MLSINEAPAHSNTLLWSKHQGMDREQRDHIITLIVQLNKLPVGTSFLYSNNILFIHGSSYQHYDPSIYFILANTSTLVYDLNSYILNYKLDLLYY